MGVLVAVYTTCDAWGIRLTPDPFTLLAWFFCIWAVDFPTRLAGRLWRGRVSLPVRRPLIVRGIFGAPIAFVSFVSFGGVMKATRSGRVGEVAALRETWTVIAAGIGWAVLGEKVGVVRACLMGLIALGAVLVQIG